MTKKIKATLLAVGMLGASVAGLVACGETVEPNKPNKPGDDRIHRPEFELVPDPHPGVTASTTKKYATDNRPNAFGVYTAKGELTSEDDGGGEFNDLYKAIAACVDLAEEGGYVAKLSGADKDLHMFTFKETFAADNTDQFFYYENGTSFDRYTPWDAGYFGDLGSVSKNDVTVMKTASGLATYFQGYELVAYTEAGATTQAWNVFPYNDTGIQVNLASYCGITKVEHTIKLSEAQIFPTYAGYNTTYAKIGYIFPDAYNVATFGLACDVNTGNWYYYYGNADMSIYNDTWDGTNGVFYDTAKCYLTSTWNEEGGYFVPDTDVKLTGEIVPLEDEESGSTYYVDRLTIDFGNGNVLIRDYEHSAMTACSTARFHVSLDTITPEGSPLYDNGAQFKNVKVTEAKGTVYAEIADDDGEYGDNHASLEDGIYDLLNSNEASEARFQTIAYNRGLMSYDFSTPGQDIYNFSMRLATGQPAFSTTLMNVKNKIAAIQTPVTAENEALVNAANDAYKALNMYQQSSISAAEKAKLDAAVQAAMRLHMTPEMVELVESIKGLNVLGTAKDQYNSVAALKADAETLDDLWTKLNALSADNQALIRGSDGVGTKLDDIYAVYAAIKDLADTDNVYKVIDSAMFMTQWAINAEDGDATKNIYVFYKAYNALTAEQKAALPAYITTLIGARGAELNGFDALYDLTKIVDKWFKGFELSYTELDFTWGANGWENPHLTGTMSTLWEIDPEYFTMDEAKFKSLDPVEVATVAAYYSFADDGNGYLITHGGWTLKNSHRSPALTAWAEAEGLAKSFNQIHKSLIKLVFTQAEETTAKENGGTYRYRWDVATSGRVKGKMMNYFMAGNPVGAIRTLKAAYKDETTFAGVCDMDASVNITAIANANYAALNADELAALKAIFGVDVKWAVDHRDGEYAKMDSIVEKVTAYNAATPDDAKLKEIVDLFRTIDPSSSFFFRNSTSQWAPQDGIFSTKAESYGAAWTKIQEIVAGKYVMGEGDLASWLVPVAG